MCCDSRVFEDSVEAYPLSVEVHGSLELRCCQGGKLSVVRFLHQSSRVFLGMCAARVRNVTSSKISKQSGAFES